MKKINEFNIRLKIAQKKAKKRLLKNNKNNTSSLGAALKLSTEMVAAVFVGFTIGFILDSWFDTKPWLTICFFLMGATTGILNVIRSAKKMHRNSRN